MKFILLFLLFPIIVISQGYTSYFTGNTTNITTNTEFGVCLMGGATENDNAMRWLLQKANGGDVVVLRSTGSNGYNNYLYSTLGVAVNSVETLVITSAAGAINPYVLNKVANAEMIWFAGGDQWNYVTYFKNNALEDLINSHITTKNAPVGGTSAGMAILGGKYFSAQNGSVTSAQATSNPYASNVTLGNNDFINIPILNNVITDTHFNNPDRKGRLATFLARFQQDNNLPTYGIASNEYVAVCIDNTGTSRVFGDYPNYQEFAYFVMPNCNNSSGVENCTSGQPLNWNYNGKALKVYKVPGTMTGVNSYNISNFGSDSGTGGTWEDWSVVNGVFASSPGIASNCVLNTNQFYEKSVLVIPNPVQDEFIIDGIEIDSLTFYDNLGRLVLEKKVKGSEIINIKNFKSGVYILKILSNENTLIKKIIKQ